MRYKTCSKDAIQRISKGEDEVSYCIIGHSINIVMFNISAQRVYHSGMCLFGAHLMPVKENVTMQDENRNLYDDPFRVMLNYISNRNSNIGLDHSNLNIRILL
jgi:hypothetical protein